MSALFYNDRQCRWCARPNTGTHDKVCHQHAYELYVIRSTPVEALRRQADAIATARQIEQMERQLQGMERLT